jgi:hypothetical protein
MPFVELTNAFAQVFLCPVTAPSAPSPAPTATVGVAVRVGSTDVTIVGGAARVDGVLASRGTSWFTTDEGNVQVVVRGTGVLSRVHVTFPDGLQVSSRQYGIRRSLLKTGYYQDVRFTTSDHHVDASSSSTPNLCASDINDALTPVSVADRIFPSDTIDELTSQCGGTLETSAISCGTLPSSSTVCTATSTDHTVAETACASACPSGDTTALARCTFDYCVLGGGPQAGMSCNHSSPLEMEWGYMSVSPAPPPPSVCDAGSCDALSQAANVWGATDCCKACYVYGPSTCLAYDPAAAGCCPKIPAPPSTPLPPFPPPSIPPLPGFIVQVGTAHSDEFNWVAPEPGTGHAYACGQVSGSFNGGTDSGNVDAVVVKFRPDRSIQWSAQFAGADADNYDAAFTCVLGPDGNLTVAASMLLFRSTPLPSLLP